MADELSADNDKVKPTRQDAEPVPVSVTVPA